MERAKLKNTYLSFIAENEHILNIAEIAKLGGIKYMTLKDIIASPDRWKDEDYRVEVIMKQLQKDLIDTTRRKYGGK